MFYLIFICYRISIEGFFSVLLGFWPVRGACNIKAYTYHKNSFFFLFSPQDAVSLYLNTQRSERSTFLLTLKSTSTAQLKQIANNLQIWKTEFKKKKQKQEVLKNSWRYHVTQELNVWLFWVDEQEDRKT